MKRQKAKMKGNESTKAENETKWSLKKLKMNRHEGTKRQNDKKRNDIMPKWKDMKPQKSQNQ